MAANGIENPDAIQVGQELRIPVEPAGDGATPTPSGEDGTASVTATVVPAEGTRARVIDIVDGDTIDVVIDGAQHTVRYIGMDTPKRGKEFYDEATAANANRWPAAR